MFEQLTSTDLPNQIYAELVQVREQERLARRVARERKAARVAARIRDRRTTPPRPVATTKAEPACPAAG